MATTTTPIVFKIVTYTHLDKRLLDENCSICWQPFAAHPQSAIASDAIAYHTADTADHNVTVKPLHAFHMQCVTDWFMQTKSLKNQAAYLAGHIFFDPQKAEYLSTCPTCQKVVDLTATYITSQIGSPKA